MDSSELQVQLEMRVKRRVYIPEEEDQYDAASKPLTGKIKGAMLDKMVCTCTVIGCVSVYFRGGIN